MSRARRTFGALAATALLTALAPVAAAPVSGAGAPGSGIQQLGACLAADKAGDLLLLVDQSGSLKQTDPEGVRVRAASYLLRQLAAATERLGADVDVAIAGFDATYTRTRAWGPLEETALPELDAALQEYANRNTGIDTDYVNALTGARDELRDRARSGSERCSAVIWFTDGKFDIEPRTSERSRERHGTTKPYAPAVSLRDAAGAARAEELGRTALCRTGGVADQLRAAGTVTLALGLGTNADDFSLLQGIATGTDGTACGRRPQDTVGEFVLAGDVDDLLFKIDTLSGVQDPATTTETGVCPRVACEEQAHVFVLDQSISRVHVLAGADAEGIDVLLRPPGGGEGQLFSYSGTQQVPPVQVAGQQVTARWLSTKTLDLTLVRAKDDSWTGPWSVVFVDTRGASPQAKARTQIRITGDLVPTVVGEDLQLRADDDPVLRLGLASEETGRLVPPEQVLGAASVSAVLRDAAGTEIPVVQDAAPRELAQGFPVDLSTAAPGEAVVELGLKVRTADVPAAGGRPAVPGTVLAERLVDVPVTILPPLDFPQVASSVDFGRTEGTTAQRSLRVTGPGCVWVQGTEVTASPEGVGAVRVTSPASSPATCVRVEQGQTGEVPLALSVDETGNGTVAGTVDVQLAPLEDPERAVTAPVGFLGDLRRPANPPVLIGVLVAAMLLGLGLPVVFLYAVRRWAARMPGTALLTGLVEVEVDGSSVTRGGAPLSFSDTDVRFLPVPQPVRELSPVPGVTLRTRTSWKNPTDPGWTEVDAPGRAVVTSGAGGRLSLAVQNSWVALLDEPDRRRVTLLLLLPTSASPQLLASLADSVREKLPREVARLRTEAGTVPQPVGATAGFEMTPPPPPPPGLGFGGGTPGSPAAPAPPPPGPPPEDPPSTGGSLW